MRVTVLGLGLVGGSVAQALTDHQVLGFDVDPVTRDAAGRWGLPVTDDLGAALDAADLVVLAAPVGANDDLLAEVAQRRPEVLVTDVGSAKVPLVQRWQALGARQRLVPGHPMAGAESAGWSAADPALLLGARWVLCPGPWTTPEDWLAVARLVVATGAVVVPAHPVRHDEAVAAASHAPHVLAALVAATTAGSPLATSLAAGSFRDATRVAAAPPERTAEFVFANRQPVAELLHRFADELREAAEELEAMDRSSLLGLLGEGRAGRERWESAHRPARTTYPVPIGEEGWAEELHDLADAGGVVTGVQGSLLTVAVPHLPESPPPESPPDGGAP